VNIGAYGTKDGPMTSPANGARWFWNLEAAKKQALIDRCSALRSCSSVEDSSFAGCGFSITKQKGIPVDSAGNSLYNDAALYTPKDKIITKVAQCPPPPSVSAGPGVVVGLDGVVDTCKQLPNNKLSRDCIMRTVLDAGCSTSGTMYRALQSGNSLNYARGIDANKAYKTYQQRSKTQLNHQMMRDGDSTLTDALRNIKAVQDVATSSANDGLAFASRDLCLNAGEIDAFDFCSEISMSTPGPYSIECLQKLFRQKGGTPGGSWWPSANTIAWYNRTFNRWGDIIKGIDTEVARMESGTGNQRVNAYKNIMGINLEPIPIVNDGIPCKISTETNGINLGRLYRIQNTNTLSQCQTMCCEDPSCRAYNYKNGRCILIAQPGRKMLQVNTITGKKS
jgi:hypothetical protein